MSDLIEAEVDKKEEKLRISASSLRSLTDCSLAFYYRRILNLPEKDWPKTIIGSLAHSIFECLRHERHEHHVYLITVGNKEGIDYSRSRAITRLVRMWQSKYKIEQILIDDINDLLHVGINCTDFFWEKADKDPETGKPLIYGPEYPFSFTLEDGTEIRGKIDDMAVVDGVMNVRDFKSAKNKETVADVPNNVQALTYQAFIWLTFKLPARVEFIYLRHGPTKRTPTKFLQVVEPVSDMHILGFLSYAKWIYGRINQFSLEDAYLSPHEDIFFCQRVCTHYAPHPYWVVCSADDPKGLVPVSSHLELAKANESCKNGQTILERFHKGCGIRWSG